MGNNIGGDGSHLGPYVIHETFISNLLTCLSRFSCIRSSLYDGCGYTSFILTSSGGKVRNGGNWSLRSLKLKGGWVCGNSISKQQEKWVLDRTLKRLSQRCNVA